MTTVLGREFVQNIYKETQRIEGDGGMMIHNNRRRRTSGGVFLFLVKHDDVIGEEKKREAFKPVVDEEAKRDEDIEELKKTLITQDSPKLRPLVDSIRAQEMCSTREFDWFCFIACPDRYLNSDYPFSIGSLQPTSVSSGTSWRRRRRRRGMRSVG